MARKIYKTTDKISVKIDDIVVQVSPLSFEQKCDIQALLVSGDPMSVVRAASMAIKYGVKGLEGVENADGSLYVLETDENGSLSDQCVDDLLNIDQDDKLSLVCTSLLNGIPKDIVDPQTGKKIKGITIERYETGKKK
jgi:hypothetical protein